MLEEEINSKKQGEGTFAGKRIDHDRICIQIRVPYVPFLARVFLKLILTCTNNMIEGFHKWHGEHVGMQ